jgi:hypothetical protein
MTQFEQWANTKFCQKLGKSPTETFNMMKQVCGEEALGHSAMFKWRQLLRKGRDRLEDDEHSGLTPCDFFIFHRLKAKLHGHRFLSSDAVINARRDTVWEFPANMFQQCFRQLYQSWQTCIAANGDYFEGRCGSV